MRNKNVPDYGSEKVKSGTPRRMSGRFAVMIMADVWTTKNKLLLGLIGVLIFLNVSVFQEVFALAGPRYLRLEAFNVGQGDSLFIQTPSRRVIMVDGGPDRAVLSKLAARLPFWQKRIDVVVLTHPDSDHISGLLSVLEKYRVDYIIWTGVLREGANFRQWLSLLEKAEKRGSKIIMAKTGLAIYSGGANMEVLYPFESLAGVSAAAANDTGIVSRLSYGQKSFLLTADISSKVEQELVALGDKLAADVLKVAHHGSKYSSAESFLKAAGPGVAVISVGANNRYGHPTPEVLQRLDNFGIKVLRTDQRGDIRFLSDGNNIQIQ